MSQVRLGRVAILATNGFEQSELQVPRKRLRESGAVVDIVAPDEGEIRGWNHSDWGDSVPVDKLVKDVGVADYDMLVLPGGVINPDTLRTDKTAVDFVRAFVKVGKPVAAICHGPWMLAEADVLWDRQLTSYGSIKTDLCNAGAEWVDEPVVVSDGLITSRSPDDLDDFCDAIIETLKVKR